MDAPNTALVALAALSPATALASEAVSALRFLTALKGLPLAPRPQVSVVNCLLMASSDCLLLMASSDCLL